MIKSMAANVLQLIALLLCITAGPSAAALEIDLVYLSDETDDAVLGVKQGLVEANLQGQFLG
jgi:hypothetical protein